MTSMTVVIPVHNGAGTLDECLGAILGDGIEGLEIIMVDDGSTDGSKDIAERHGARVVVMEGRHGPAACRNRGAHEATGDVVVFLDADIRVRPGTITALAERACGPDVGAVFSPYDPATTYDSLVPAVVNLQNAYWFAGIPEEAIALVSAAMAMHHDVALATTFDEGIERASVEDIELGWTLRGRGLRVVHAVDLPVDHVGRPTLLGYWTSRFHNSRLYVHGFIHQSADRGRLFRPFDSLYMPVGVACTVAIITTSLAVLTGVLPPTAPSLAIAALAIWNLPFLAYGLRHASVTVALAAFVQAMLFSFVQVLGLTVGVLQLLTGGASPRRRQQV